MRQFAIRLLLSVLAGGCGRSVAPPAANSQPSVEPTAPITAPSDKAQDGVRQITFDDLNVRKLQKVDEVIWNNNEALPESLSQLDGKRVRIRGWIEPPEDMGFEQRAFFFFSKKPELEYARIRYPEIEPVSVGDETPEIFALESPGNVEDIAPPVADDLDFSIEIPGGINRNLRWWSQADETIHVRLRKGDSLRNTRKRSVDVVGNLKVSGITDCPPARWIYVLKDAVVVEILDAE